MTTLKTLALLVSVAALPACASMSGTDQLRGTSGPVAWEVVDVRQRINADRSAVRWDYTLVLRETTGTGIRFTTGQRGAYGPLQGNPQEFRFERRLDANSELRLNYWDETYNIRQWPPATKIVFRRYLGADDRGRPVTVDVRIPFGPSFGKATQASARPQPLPPTKALESDDLRNLAGQWHGYSRGDRGFEIPLKVTIKDDGSFEAAMDDPVTSRYRGRLRIQDGRVLYSYRNDTGTLALHEGGGKRILQGTVSGRREGLPDQPGAAPYTANQLFRLEWVSP